MASLIKRGKCSTCGAAVETADGHHHPDPWDIVSNGAPNRTKMTWRCEKCGTEWDHFTYGGPCPGRDFNGCDGELRRRRKVVPELVPEA